MRAATRRHLSPLVPALVVLSWIGCAGPPGGTSTFDVTEASITDLQAALEAGEVTSVQLVQAYLDRIEAYDQQGPALNAIISLNPGALTEAADLDAARAAGVLRGSLHGIPVLVKDNFDTADMPTTAGTIALATSRPPDDAFQVRRLREAGAIILGKTNMHELARGITTVGSLTGQTRNPYDPSRNPGGSSGGTGAAIAASFAAVGLGSDTCGSIRIPSAHHMLVGLRGTRGLASGDGIVPLSRTQDFGGPLARSVADLALTLDVTVGYDSADPATEAARDRVPESYADALDAEALAGARVGVVLALMGEGEAERPVRDVVEAALETMTGLGAEVLEIEEPDLAELVQGGSVITQEFKFDLDAYLADTPGAPVRSLAEIVAQGRYHDIIGRGLEASLEVESLDTDDYRERLATRDMVREAVERLMDERGLDALVYPTIRQTARPIDQPQPGSNCALSAISGLPALSMPGGLAEDGMPVGVELLGRAFDEARLLALAYAYEQATHHRITPDFTPSLYAVPPVVEVETDVTLPVGRTVDATATASFDPVTRELEYSIATSGLRDRDVLAVGLHRRRGVADRGPLLQVLTRGRSRVSGTLTLSGQEVRWLQDEALYIDMHTLGDVPGAIRVDFRLAD